MLSYKYYEVSFTFPMWDPHQVNFLKLAYPFALFPYLSSWLHCKMFNLQE